MFKHYYEDTHLENGEHQQSHGPINACKLPVIPLSAAPDGHRTSCLYFRKMNYTVGGVGESKQAVLFGVGWTVVTSRGNCTIGTLHRIEAHTAALYFGCSHQPTRI